MDEENIANFFKQLRSICAEEQYEIVIPERTDRPLQ